ncbi:MAG: hypothetical protein ACR2JY_23655 [Chloroflexota bacterium]
MLFAATFPSPVAVDTGLGSWETLPALAAPRWSLAVVASGGRLYAIGGVGAGLELHTVEAYDPATNGWSRGRRCQPRATAWPRPPVPMAASM